MALNTFKRNYLTALHFKGLMGSVPDFILRWALSSDLSVTPTNKMPGFASDSYLLTTTIWAFFKQPVFVCWVIAACTC